MADSQSFCQTFRKGVVDLVNPKFHKYSKPLFIAVTVGVPTAIITFLLFMSMISNCKTNVNISDGWHAHDVLSLTPPHCVFFYDELVVIPSTGQVKFMGCSSVDRVVDGKEYKAPDIPRCPEANVPEIDRECPWGDVGGIVKYSYTECPDPLATLGAALGYSAYIELVLTIVVLGILMQCGCIQRDGSYLKELLDQAKEEKGTAKDIVGAAGLA
eukprot:TRINITY_DN1331_c0_g1_i6.p1 TRINITY_DN1331_c0_g1~~TRINITY_DN1331_c0_g1_i6.p1  ORF type:complete len:233 (+),score=39.40 TRINITY_DN1331_c0_g1_i6:59-700(+)